MKKKLLIIFIACILLVSGCKKDEPEIVVESLTDKKTRVSVKFDDQKIPESTKLIVTEVASDFSNLNDKIEKYVAYDIVLKSDGEINIKKDLTVSMKIPVDFNRRNLAVYYVEDNKIKKTYDIDISKDTVTFKTNHFSIYVLAQITSDETDRIEVPRVNSVDENDGES